MCELLYPKLRPPEFECTDVEDGSLKLHYRTYREGLTNFVVGLLHGLGQLYETPVTVSVLEEKAKGADHDVFQVKSIPLTAQDAHRRLTTSFRDAFRSGSARIFPLFRLGR